MELAREDLALNHANWVHSTYINTDTQLAFRAGHAHAAT